MKNVIGGLISIILGIFCFTLFFPAFLNFLTGIIPLFLILGGCLAIYLKHGEGTTDSWDNNENTEASSPTVPTETAPEGTEPEEARPVKIEPDKIEPEKIKPVEKLAENPGDDIPQLFGNTDSHVFHSSDCQYSKSKKCTAIFTARDKALQEGYKPCKSCKP